MPRWLHFALPFFLEISALLAVIYSVHRAQKNRIYPALWQLLIFWVASDALLLIEVLSHHLHISSSVFAYKLYVVTYGPAFFINAVLMLRVLHEMFRHAVRSIPGVQQLGRPIFFWAIVVSAIMATAAGTNTNLNGMDFLQGIAQVFMRSEAVLALCMLAFLAFASNHLGVSFGSRIFGVIFGFGLMATVNLVNAAFLKHITSLGSGTNMALEIPTIAAMLIWMAYFLKPEPARRLVALPTASPLMRWNDIAQTLGNPAGQVAISYPPSFMKDVVELVDSVMGPAGWPAAANASRPPGPIAS